MASSSSNHSLAGRARNRPGSRPLASRDFRLLFVGQAVSMLGDQFYLLALPWLVLQMTGSVFAVGTIMMAATIPRMVFLLVGGAVSDWLSPHKLMVASSVFRSLVCAILTALVLLNTVSLWHLFVLAAAFGTLDAFFAPALKSFIPALLDDETLVAGNSLLQGSNMLAKVIGPSLAGFIYAVAGAAMAFALDTVSFIFVTACLLLMRTKRVTGSAEPKQTKLFASILEGLRYTLREPAIRSLIILLGVIEFAFAGPLTVGILALANSRFAGGEKAFGIMLSTLGGGFLLGTIIANWFKRTRIGYATFVGALVLGGLLALLGAARNLLLACILLAVIATIGGFLQVLNAVWFQTRPDPRMLGRVMSVVMLFGFGLTPLSYVIAGALLKVSTPLMFAANGVFLLAAVLFLLPARRKIDETKAVIAAT